MAHSASAVPLPGTPKRGQDSSDWMHDLTPTLSDEAMFDEDGHVKPLQVWPTETQATEPKADLRLVRKDEASNPNEKA